VLGRPDAGNQRRMTRVRHCRDHSLDSFGVGSFFQETAQVGDFATVSIRCGDVVGAKAIDGNQYEERRRSFLLSPEAWAKKLATEKKSTRKK